jgi:hypothetical protein
MLGKVEEDRACFPPERRWMMIIIDIHVDNLDEKTASPRDLVRNTVGWQKRLRLLWDKLTAGIKKKK